MGWGLNSIADRARRWFARTPMVKGRAGIRAGPEGGDMPSSTKGTAGIAPSTKRSRAGTRAAWTGPRAPHRTRDRRPPFRRRRQKGPLVGWFPLIYRTPVHPLPEVFRRARGGGLRAFL
jgi:hypothetical protein